jgi:hypothetical protein
MAIYVQTSPYGGPEIGEVERSFFGLIVIHITEVRTDRKNAVDFHSSTQACASLL